ncbi:MAG: DNA alkylation repair protein [Solirubrobacterales bacterium]
MSLGAAADADAIEAELRSLGTPERAEGEKRYLKSELEFVGATLPQVERVAKEFAAAHPAMTRGEVLGLAEALWSKPVHERRAAAVSLLERHAELIAPRDLKLVERLVRGARTWALVDPLAVHVLGGILLRYPRSAARLNRWSRDEDFWVRRASLLAWLMPLKEGQPADRFLRYADLMLDEKEFFIRKAIGWVLRDAGRTRPAEVVHWLETRTDRASGVTLREALKYVDEADRERLMAAYREKRQAVETVSRPSR